MRVKYLLVLLGIVFSIHQVYANDVVHLAITEPQAQQDIVDETEDENIIILDNLNEEDTVKAKIDYNDINKVTPLLSKYTAMNFEHGPFESINPFLVYQGNFNFNFVSDDEYHTEYQNPLLDVNINGKFKNVPIEFSSQYNLYSKKGYNYMQTFFKDQYLKFKYIPHNDIYVGHYKVPIGIEGCASNYTMPFINQSQIARNFAQTRATGIKVMGDYKLVEYNLSVSSSDRYFHTFFPGVEFAGMAFIKPFGITDGKYGDLKIGGGLNIGHRNNHYQVISAAVSYTYKKIGLIAEYAFADGSNGATGETTNRAQGAVATVTYNITPKLQILARYDIFNSNMDVKDKIVSEYVAGINYFIKGSSMKLLLNYIFRHSQEGLNSHMFLVGTQIIL